jgi:hypothetical protein
MSPIYIKRIWLRRLNTNTVDIRVKCGLDVTKCRARRMREEEQRNRPIWNMFASNRPFTLHKNTSHLASRINSTLNLMFAFFFRQWINAS